MEITRYCSNFSTEQLGIEEGLAPWEIVSQLSEVLSRLIPTLGPEYLVEDGVAIHTTANVDATAQIKAPAVIGPDCFIGPGVLLRGGVYLTGSVTVGPTCEVKSTIVCSNSAIAHFNYVGDSIIGSEVDLEAGAMIVNYYNERENKEISVFVDGEKTNTRVIKFGAVVGDRTKIGANAVIAPGAILEKGTIVGRLELVDQAVPNE